MEELIVESLGNGVGGVAKPVGSRVTFIPGALPGERVLCEPGQSRGSWREASLVEILSPSPGRVEPFCPLSGECGGCSLQHLRYEEQLVWKREWVSSALSRARITHPGVEPVRPSVETRGYRNRVTFEVERGILCLHRRRGDTLAAGDCPLLHGRGRETARALSGNAGAGPCRIAVKASFLDGRTAVELDGGAPPFPGLPPGTAAWRRGRRGWEGRADAEPLREEIAGATLRVPVGGFFQVNTRAASEMSSFIADSLGGCGGLRVLDLYGGAGTFSVPLAARGARALCVDSSPESIAAARASAADLGPAVAFEALLEDAGAFLSDAGRRGGFDAVIADPPRAGMGSREAGELAGLEAGMIVMVSCNPFTLARDLSFLSGSYRVTRVTPFDLFPHTDHVETVCFLERKPREARE